MSFSASLRTSAISASMALDLSGSRSQPARTEPGLLVEQVWPLSEAVVRPCPFPCLCRGLEQKPLEFENHYEPRYSQRRAAVSRSNPVTHPELSPWFVTPSA